MPMPAAMTARAPSCSVTHFSEANRAAATTNRHVCPSRRTSISNSRVLSTPSSRRISAVMRAVKLGERKLYGLRTLTAELEQE